SRHKDYQIVIEKNRLFFNQTGVLRFTATVDQHNIAHLDGYAVPNPEQAALASTCPMDLDLWHRRFLHINNTTLADMHSKGTVKGLVLDSKTPPKPICEPCIGGKQHVAPIPRTAPRAKEVLFRVYCDVKGPLPTTPSGFKHWILFVDDATRMWAIQFLRKKSDAALAIKRFIERVERQVGKKLKIFRDDKGGEFISTALNEYFADKGIAREHTNTNKPHQNGVAERPHRTIAEGITAMLLESHLPANWWDKAAAAFVHVRNRSLPSTSDTLTPYEAWSAKKPDVSYFRVFGCVAYVHVQKKDRKAFQSHSKRCIFVGYPPDYPGWEFYHPESRRFIISTDAIFDERYYPGLHSPIPPPSLALFDEEDVPDVPPPEVFIDNNLAPAPDAHQDTDPVPGPAPVEQAPEQGGVDHNHDAAQLPAQPAPPPPIQPDPPVPVPAPPAPAPATPRYPQRQRNPPSEWWKTAAHPKAAPPPAPDAMREPTPVIASDTEDEDELNLRDEEEALCAGFVDILGYKFIT
ncbi:MAG TPA: hypothetical protein VHV10_13435, partial [Ktedonobacteraceae bacterium]|nr:hypothetical protein [Ktedonobacteraceae bacterium]